MSQFRPILTLAAIAAALTAAERFVTKAGAYPAAGAKALGCARAAPSAIGEMVTVDVLGTAIGTAGAAFADDADLELDATGRVITRVSGVRVAKALAAAGAAGDRIELLLTP
jgi:hypothetical protein